MIVLVVELNDAVVVPATAIWPTYASLPEQVMVWAVEPAEAAVKMNVNATPRLLKVLGSEPGPAEVGSVEALMAGSVIAQVAGTNRVWPA
jgi:hypothetical protein